MREFSFRAIVLGVLVGALLAAANAFVGLKVGMTISASIPAAVISLLIMRKLLSGGTLLESNMVQTVGSAGESVAAGMIFTIPALFMMGTANPVYLDMVIWGAIGGLLGVCFMVPLRQILIVKEHGVLPYPEGVACAEVLESGERGGAGAKSVIWGALVGAFFYLFSQLGIWKETGRISIQRFRTEAQLDVSPALLGVGYILGARVAGYMLGGAVLSWFILIPAIAFFGDAAQAPIYPATEKVVSEMQPKDIYDNYIRYIGAGAVAIGGLISLFKSFGTIARSMWHVLAGLFTFRRGVRPQTDKDFPLPLLVLIVAGLGYAMWHFDQVRIDHIGIIALLIFTFFFVTVSSRLVGIVGSSSNPVSGMTIATLLGTALVYKIFVVDRNADMSADDLMKLKLTVLSVSAIACIAISVAGDTSQDLKTGFLVKATPYKQQVGEMIGVLTSVLAIAGVILLLNDTMGFVKGPDHPNPLPAYQANIMKILTEGVLGGQVPWTLILIGGAAAVIIEMLGLPALPFAVGMYLPLGLSTPIMMGGLIAWWVQRKRKKKADHDVGVLTASGLVAGQGLIGVAMAGVMAFISSDARWTNPLTGAEEPVMPAHLGPWLMHRFDFIPTKWGLCDAGWEALPMAPFALLAIWLWWCARKRPAVTIPPDPGAATAPPRPVQPPSPEPPPESFPSPTDVTDKSPGPDAPQLDVVDDSPAAPSPWAAPPPDEDEPPSRSGESTTTPDTDQPPPDPFAPQPDEMTPASEVPSPWAPAMQDEGTALSKDDSTPPPDTDAADTAFKERRSLLGDTEDLPQSDVDDEIPRPATGDDIDEALRESRRRLKDLGSKEDA